MNKVILCKMFLLFSAQAMADFQVVSGCEETDYLLGDRQASIAIQGMAYTPRCLQVTVGSEVTISANNFHPLAPIPTQESPILNSVESQTVTFDRPGVYGYFCPHHGSAAGEGMAGAIWVVDEVGQQGGKL